jgi:hypothetical protein
MTKSKLEEIDIFDPISEEATTLDPIIVEDTVVGFSEVKRKLTKAEQRAFRNQQSENRKIVRRVNQIRATDEYVKSLERQLVDHKTFTAVRNLDEDFNNFTKTFKERQNAKDKEKS